MIFIVTIYSYNEFYINEVKIPPPPANGSPETYGHNILYANVRKIVFWK